MTGVRDNGTGGSDLTKSEVDQILRLIDNAPFDVIEIGWKGLTLHLSRGETAAKRQSMPAPAGQPTSVAPEPAAPAAPDIAANAAADPAPVSDTRQDRPAPDNAVPADCTAIAAPTMGTFYRSPEPGADPFVDVGGHVDAGETLALIEVMKVFSSISAECSGVVREIRAQDGDLVEYGQTIFVIEADA
ncbi:acetyl-CoA carboxylase biotin carboxyl carrier protein [Microbaculum marinisediminis]|uniref:Biotin carboxyl carrier protein of acetyl-CoA carboxylase n=1 Tax=Microbaculum marinisediminis TaxID=2931392 RepID=A0AAW5R4D6_9HYPH|nr:biotin/lipoyl-containing protein [Microbaculum sp. A6E488]MCT8973528.1 hypothetical protein [Microbaculum sp. A6E488]